MEEKGKRLLQKRKLLTPEQYRVCRQKGTEPAFSGKYCNHHEKGKYKCTFCGAPLFSSDTKYDSGTGWPSFSKPVADDALITAEDHSFGLERTEVMCKKCGSHMGHVFKDEPDTEKKSPTGIRYCVNSLALEFEAEK
ncbi:MAG: peptide-methionine (R)-S-oxide reductase [Verrucomicrobia bacterium CG_4_10_14_3_um_filter_43_23]|nr:MAG: peptide-methionine (R)-S-oxide reductase [Verrucomicrobia bacterium CG1_02_43_26]PIP58674.1 MAG: peptide-methionine (R)-S-oxide reductase [Verrucomicrobia bacterium CG22_combo_CG10-13_8_21_14_all_43_17]PIX58075.1 MAG: peptide-methionine (R)-S-oxide reductase [Verrucomicrobia bacterium CG_4_10_14_3_um_filter_43_23]PIY61170.1 MAG: peptide-methionine (R)-S-oxide reductase [Verrucomicrobia bacterium CG_4_10_14_0_8_um_filter_43_34]PJA43343.1 MAG: peptide-methionine (R)-S-oxide reductase [Ver